MAGFYNEKIIDHFKHPRNVGVIKNPNAVGCVRRAPLGIIAELYLRIETGVVTEVKFKAFGCGGTIASISIVTEMIKGSRLDEIASITNEDVDKALGGLPASKLYCAKLGSELIQSALKDYREHL